MMIHTKHFEVSFENVDAAYGAKISTLIEDVCSQIITTFALADSEETYRFVLCRDVQEYIRETEKTVENYQPWMIGWADHRQKKLCILSPRAVTDRTETEMDKVIVHEIVHIALDALGDPDDINICLAEGIAVFYASQINKNEIHMENPPSFWSIYEEAGFYEFGGYQYSGIYVVYLLHRYGAEVFKALYTGERDIHPYITETFEKDALAAFFREETQK